MHVLAAHLILRGVIAVSETFVGDLASILSECADFCGSHGGCDGFTFAANGTCTIFRAIKRIEQADNLKIYSYINDTTKLYANCGRKSLSYSEAIEMPVVKRNEVRFCMNVSAHLSSTSDTPRIAETIPATDKKVETPNVNTSISSTSRINNNITTTASASPATTTRPSTTATKNTTTTTTTKATTTTGFCREGWKKFGKSCYKNVDNPKKNFNDAAQHCQEEQNSHLVYITSEQEDDFVHELATNEYYIGLIYNNTVNEWMWLDNTPLNFTHWEDNEPQEETTKSCGHYHLNGWKTIGCHELWAFVCEYS